MGTYDQRQNQYKPIEDIRALTGISRAVVSTALRIVIGDIPIGYLQSWTENQNLPQNPQYEIGSVEIVEHTPGNPSYTLSCSKLAVYRVNMLKIFQQIGQQKKDPVLYEAIKTKLGGDGIVDFSTIVEQGIPFDIKMLERDPIGDRSIIDDNSQVVMTAQWIDCKISSFSRAANAQGNLTITETINLVARKPSYSSSGYSAPI